MNELLADNVYFGVAASLLAYRIGCFCRKKWDNPLMNPLLIATVLLIGFLMATGTDFEVYSYGAKYITYFLTPATVCLAVPLYRQISVLKHNMTAVLIGIACGSAGHLAVVLGLGLLSGMKEELLLSVLPKSVTTAIALGVSGEIGGIQSVTVVGVMIAGMLGAILGPALLKLFRVEEPAAQGLAMGTAAHAIGTAKAMELGELQGAMSSLAIVVTGLLTVVIVPMAAGRFF